ncbi:MAG: hypothetical protein EBZ40_00110 [Gammaproteobacteria bacterium]|nr:hypothetical protein [Gammaproteobacteria bacterium]
MKTLGLGTCEHKFASLAEHRAKKIGGRCARASCIDGVAPDGHTTQRRVGRRSRYEQGCRRVIGRD